MTEKNISTKIQVLTYNELTSEDKKVVDLAKEATKSSYTPYSHFNVGAALLLDNGVLIKGANQENAAYPSGLCAERTAISAAKAQYPEEAQVSIAITSTYADGSKPGVPASPCGACRQVMAEYQKIAGENMSIILVGGNYTLKFEKVDDLLPFIFTSLD